MSGPLDPVLKWYEMAQDSLRLTSRVVNKQIKQAIPNKHILRDLDPNDAAARIKEAQQELDNLVVVALEAVFERVLREYLTEQIVPRLRKAAPFDQGVRDQVTEDIEYWNITRCLIDKLFKHRVSGDLCGMVKQIIDYRNDVAHGHVKGKPPPANLTPVRAYERLSEFLREGGVIS